jgi:hypothetical protein
MAEAQNSFCCGSLYGFIAAGIIAFILVKLREARLKMGLRNRPLSNFPDAAQPEMTSSSVVSTSRQAALAYAIWTFMLLVILAMVASGFFYLMDWVI